MRCMRYLVTGGAGFIGSNIALELEARGNEVVVLDAPKAEGRTTLRGFSGEVILEDLRSDFEPKLSGKFDAIFHQGAITDPRHPDDKEVWDVNVSTFPRIIALAKDHNKIRS